MAGERITAFFDDRAQAQRAVDELKANGFSDEEVTLGGEGGFLDALLPRSERDGRTRVRVTSARQMEAASILNRMGGRDGEPEQAQSQAPDGRGTANGQVIELLEEEPYPSVSPVQVGEVRVTKVVQTEMRTIEVPVRREEIVVERLPIKGSSSAAAEVGDISGNAEKVDHGVTIVHEAMGPAGRGPEGEARPNELPPQPDPSRIPTSLGADEEIIRVPLLEEQVLITLRPVVREEVLLRKRRVTEPQTHEVEIQREELQVERDGEAEVEERQLAAAERERGEVG